MVEYLPVNKFRDLNIIAKIYKFSFWYLILFNIHLIYMYI